MSLFFITGIIVVAGFALEQRRYFKRLAQQDQRRFALQRCQGKIWKVLRDNYPAITPEMFNATLRLSKQLDKKLGYRSPAPNKFI